MRAADLVLGGLLSLRARKLRAALSAVGIAIGIAAVRRSPARTPR